MDQIAQLVLNGLSIGSIIALSSVGLTLTYGILRLSNFAHGDLMTLGAYLTLLLQSLGLNIWVAMILAAIAVTLVALGLETTLWAPMRKQRASATTLIIISIGVALCLRNGIIMFWGAGPQNYDLPTVPAMALGNLRVEVDSLIVMAMAIAGLAGLHYVLNSTKVGKAMRAVADDVDLARVTGINVDRVIFWTWILSAVLTALAGSMLGLIEQVNPNMGWFLILPLFASVILGGIGNPYGAIAGSYIIGIAQELSTAVVPASYKAGIALLLMMGVLLIRPQGLFRGTM
ncbi:MAG: branched-chain amino acid ABC transporter permease [Synechococcales bacterium]|nr:branched-chain amino acid ABC transporter permease [Synechococcales bacterium]